MTSELIHDTPEPDKEESQEEPQYGEEGYDKVIRRKTTTLEFDLNHALGHAFLDAKDILDFGAKAKPRELPRLARICFETFRMIKSLQHHFEIRDIKTRTEDDWLGDHYFNKTAADLYAILEPETKDALARAGITFLGPKWDQGIPQ